jgi:hypothetical protein
MSRPSTGENVSRAACPARTLIRIFARMKLVFLHGAPATGKLTVAKALLNVVPGRLLDNHAAIDFARTIFEFGAPGFWELVHQIRLAALEAAAQHGVPLVVVTFCYSDPTDLPQFEEFERLVLGAGGELLPLLRRRNRPSDRQFRSCRETEDVIDGGPQRLSGHLQRRARAARQLLQDRYRRQIGRGDRAGNRPPFRSVTDI